MLYVVTPYVLLILFCFAVMKFLEWSQADKGEFSLFRSKPEKVVNSPLAVPYLLSLFSIAGSLFVCAVKLAQAKGWL